MIKVTVLYKNADNAKFDLDYFLNRHIPLLRSVIGDKAANMAVDQGLAGGPAPGTPPPFVAMAHLYFNTMEDFQAAMSTGAETIMNDIPNYTNCEPIIQISEVKL
jgi:uncharacterized protein (TIGR02118 family)